MILRILIAAGAAPLFAASCAHVATPVDDTEPAVVADAAEHAEALTEEEQWLARFRSYSDAATAAEYAPSPEHPWGRLNPDAPPETEQYAFMVGEHLCTTTLTGINPHRDDGAVEDKLLWRAYYAFDGRGIRDQFYQMGGIGQQFRLYDPTSDEWQITYAATRGVIDLGRPFPTRGDFVSRRAENGDMQMYREQTDADGEAFTQRITFHAITEDGFLWKSDQIRGEEITPQGGVLDCRRTAGPARDAPPM